MKQPLLNEQVFAPAHFLNQFSELDIPQAVEFVLTILNEVFTEAPASLASTIGGHGARSDNEVGIRVAVRMHEACHGVRSSHIPEMLARNPHLPSDIVDWLIDLKEEELFVRHSGGLNGIPRQTMTDEQIERAVRTFPTKGPMTAWVQERRYALPEELVREYAHRWIDDLPASNMGLFGDAKDQLNAWMRSTIVDEAFVAKVYQKFKAERVALLANPLLPQEVFEEACQEVLDPKHPDPNWVKAARQELVKNPRLSEEYLWLLFNDRESWSLIAMNPNLPTDILKTIIRDGDIEAKKNLLHNKGLDATTWNRVMHNILEAGWVPANGPSLLSDPRCDKRTLALLWEKDDVSNQDRCVALFSNPNTTTKLRIQIIAYVAVKEWSKSCFLQMLQNDALDLPAEVLVGIADRMNGGSTEVTQIRELLALHPNFPTPYLQGYLIFKTGNIAHYAARALRDRGIA